MFFFVFISTNSVTGNRFIGHCSSPELREEYFGNSPALLRELRRYGVESFSRHIIMFGVSMEELGDIQAQLITWMAKTEQKEFFSLRHAVSTDLRARDQLYREKRRKLFRDKICVMPKGNRGNDEFRHTPETLAKISMTMRTKKAREKRKWFHNPADPHQRKLLQQGDEIPFGWMRGKGPTRYK